METKILHLSDLHLGDDFVWRSLLHRRTWWHGQDNIVLEQLADAIRRLAPDYVVISGDIVNKCSPETFGGAVATLQALFQKANVDMQTKLLIVPGNHDVRVIPEDDEVFGRVKEFLRFLKGLFREADYRARSERFVVVDAARRIAFFGLDSTLKTGHGLAEGAIGTAQLKWLEEANGALAENHPEWDQFLKVAILHHHLHPIAAGGAEKFMQLLDAGDTIRAFERIGINLVLHGHKHVPHILPYVFGAEGNGLYTVIGSGTACCPYLEEQGGAGNNFAEVRVNPLSNVLEVSRYKADNNRQFVREAQTKLPLLRPSPRGYRIHEHHFHSQINDHEGNCLLVTKQTGLCADSNSGDGLKQIVFFLGGFPDHAEIEEFRLEGTTIADVVYDTPKGRLTREREGVFVLKDPLSWGGDPIDLQYRSRVKRAFQMRRDPDGADNIVYESVELTMYHYCDRARLSVQFPDGFAVTPQARIRDENRQDIDVRKAPCELQYDDGLNRHTLVVRSPKLHYEYSLVWRVP